jgi:FdhE protein
MSENAASEAAQRHLQKKLAELREKRHLPEDLITVVGETAALQLAARDEVFFGGDGKSLPNTTLARVTPAPERAQGKPALRPTDFPLEPRHVGDLAQAILTALGATVPFLGPFVHTLEQRLRTEPGFLEESCRAVQAEFAGDEPASSCLREWSTSCPEAPGLLRFAIQSAMMPSVEAVADFLGPEHENGSAWPHGHCPICGGAPFIGRLAGDGGARLHVCSFCSFEYRAPRTDCPFCLAPLADGADYYTAPEEPGYSIAACPTCRNYLKLADFRSGNQVWLPKLEDLGSLALDFYAESKGYTRPTPSAWGF